MIHDDRQFPLAIVRFSTLASDHGEDMAFFVRCAARGPFALVGDCSEVTRIPSAAERPLMYAHTKALVNAIANTCVHNALVITHPMMRATLSAITWAIPTNYPITIHATMAEATAAVRATLQKKLQPESG
jgi:hypothetical protein